MILERSVSFPKSVRLRTRRQYQRVSHRCAKRQGRIIMVDVCSNNNQLTRLGITASRHFGIAVQRNRFKRIVREAFRKVRNQLPVGFDIIVKPKPAAKGASTADIIDELLNLLS